MDEVVLTEKELQALVAIRTSIFNSGRPPLIRELMAELGYASPRSVSYVLDRLEDKGYIARPGRGQIRIIADLPESSSHAITIPVPLLGRAPCGTPVFAEENVQALIPVSRQIARGSYRYFLLEAVGDSMNERGIREGCLVLVRQQQTANNGDIVVALIDGEATIKEFHRTDNAIVLKPRSSNDSHQPIILTHDFRVMGIVQEVIEL